MKKHLLYAVIIGCLGMLSMLLLMSVLHIYIIHPFVLPIALIFVVSFIVVAVMLKMSTGSTAQTVMMRVLKATWLSTVITNLPLLFAAGYYLLLKQQNPGLIYRDQSEVAFSIFLFITGIGFVLGIVLSLVARHFVNRQYSVTLPEKMT